MQMFPRFGPRVSRENSPKPGAQEGREPVGAGGPGSPQIQGPGAATTLGTQGDLGQDLREGLFAGCRGGSWGEGVGMAVLGANIWGVGRERRGPGSGPPRMRTRALGAGPPTCRRAREIQVRSSRSRRGPWFFRVVLTAMKTSSGRRRGAAGRAGGARGPGSGAGSGAGARGSGSRSSAARAAASARQARHSAPRARLMRSRNLGSSRAAAPRPL